MVPGQATLGQLRLRARRRADRVLSGAPVNAVPDPYANEFITSPELTGYVNDSYYELYDLMVTTYGNHYFVSTWQFITDGVNEQFQLPLDMFKLLGAEWVQSPGSNAMNVTLKPFPLGERNLWSENALAVVAPLGGLSTSRYRINGNNLWLKPRPQGGYTLQLLYVPRLTPLADVGNITLSGVVANDVLVINGVTFTAGNQFSVGTSDTATATNLATALNSSTLGGAAGILSATSSSNVVSFALVQPAVITWSAANSTGTGAAHMILDPNTITGPTQVITLSSVVNGNTVTVNGTTFTAGAQFTVGATDVATAASLATTIKATLGINATQQVQAVGGAPLASVQLTSISTSPITLGPASPTFTLNTQSWTNVMTGYSGWDEYVVVDAAIKMLQKEPDPEKLSVLMGQKQALERRIEAACDNRDEGAAATVTDVYGTMGPFASHMRPW